MIFVDKNDCCKDFRGAVDEPCVLFPSFNAVEVDVIVVFSCTEEFVEMFLWIAIARRGIMKFVLNEVEIRLIIIYSINDFRWE